MGRMGVLSAAAAALCGGTVSAQAGPLAFYALCAADPCAWIASDSVLMVPFVRNIMKMDYRYMHRHRIRHETHEA